jgi:lipopolysaccharide transport system permease protein
MIDFLVALPLLLVFVPFSDIKPGWGLLLLPVIFVLLVLTAAGVGTMLAALNVRYRDFRYIIPFLVQLWMYATPTIYFDLSAEPANAPANPATPNDYAWLKEWIKQGMAINPLTGLVGSFRAALFGDAIPWTMLGFSAVMAVAFFLIGCFYYRKVEDTFADVI